MYKELVERLRDDNAWKNCDFDFIYGWMHQAADAIEELSHICDAMKPKYDAACVKCAYYAEAEYNDKGFLICPASGMDITAWDFCSYFEPPKEEM